MRITISLEEDDIKGAIEQWLARDGFVGLDYVFDKSEQGKIICAVNVTRGELAVEPYDISKYDPDRGGPDPGEVLEELSRGS